MKVAVIIIGVIVALAGAGCTVGGAALAAVVGSDGWITSGTDRLDTPTYALTSESTELTDEEAGWVADRFDDVRIRIRAEATDPSRHVFIGIGRAADVNRYLQDVEHDVITDIDFAGDFDISKSRRPGTRAPEDPASQTFWTHRASGPGRQEVDWNVVSGEYRAVLMNADGSRGVDTRGSFGVLIPHVFAFGIGLVVAGVIVMVAGIVIIVLAARSAAKPREAPPAPPSAAPPPEAAPPTA